MARSSGLPVGTVLEQLFDDSDSEEPYSPSSEEEEESEGSETRESPATNVQIAGGGDAPAAALNEESDIEPPKKKTRKRIPTPESWKKNQRKQQRNSGKRYTSTSGLLVSAFKQKNRFSNQFILLTGSPKTIRTIVMWLFSQVF